MQEDLLKVKFYKNKKLVIVSGIDGMRERLGVDHLLFILKPIIKKKVLEVLK
jgi:hypothetical protein